MKKSKVLFVVPRFDSDSKSVAIVEANFKSKDLSESEFYKRLRYAITDWVFRTQDGENEYKKSSEDFNIGDLANCCGRASLKPYLAVQGISNLKIQAWDQPGRGSWIFDDRLVTDGRS